MNIQNQRGAALIAGLLILVVLSILGITTMQSSVLQERMAGNLEQRDIAFQLAEAGLRDAEAWITNGVGADCIDENWSATVNTLPGVYRPPNGGLWTVNNTWTTVANRFEYAGGDLAAGSPLPLYYIEYLDDFVDNPFDPMSEVSAALFRITSRGVSPNGLSTVVLQSTFRCEP